MALPVLNDKPKYTMTIPSTGKKIRYRPYLVKEEKILLLASQTEDVKQMMDSVVDTVLACTEGNLKKENLTTFDVEYMFLKIRSKSVGEIAEIGLKCEECKEVNKTSINIEDIECVGGRDNKHVRISDEVAIEMKYPTYSSIDYVDDETELGFQIISQCLKTVITEDERIDMEDETPQSIRNFLESMTKEQFETVANFLEDMPQVKKNVDYVCQKCGHNNHLELKGISSFF
jgi:hypothetical protein